MTDPNHAAPTAGEAAGGPVVASATVTPGAAATGHFTRHFRAAMTDGDRRADAQQHLDSRAQRISDYAGTLEAALATNPTGDRAAVLQRRLNQARQDLASASRSRLADPTTPKARSARVRLTGASNVDRARATDPAPAIPAAPAAATVAVVATPTVEAAQ